MQKYYEDDYERISNRVKRRRAKPAVPLWDWDQTYEVRVPGNGWHFPRKFKFAQEIDAQRIVDKFINS